MNSDSLKNEVHVIPEICSKCKKYWMIEFFNNKIESFCCVDNEQKLDTKNYSFEIELKNNMLENFNWIKNCDIYEKRKKINENGFYSFILKPIVINDELNEAMKNVFFPNEIELISCPYYFEHQLSNWNKTNE